MSVVLHLRPRETVSVDTITISALFRRLGPYDAEASIVCGMTALTDQMRDIDRNMGVQDLDTIASAARQAQKLAQDLGFISLTTVLGAFSTVCQVGDIVALTAIWARAKRIGDKSFVDLWELPQLQM